MKLDLKKILEIEDQFSQNSYRGDVRSDQSVKVKQGVIPVMISAPHTTKQIRNGKEKEADVYTGALALILHEITGCHVILNTKLGEDPNYILGGHYKEVLGEHCLNHKVDLVIDVHGAAANRTFGVDLGTSNGKTLSKQKRDVMIDHFPKANIEATVNKRFTASHPGTITYHSSNALKMEAVQIEINRKYRDPRRELDLFVGMVGCLSGIIEMIINGK
ncbi:N-formylglutamate amidohydrolase [Bacillus sp. es.036]|uniref:N-formylglutamate amidohydrolase n=1 Tax=Bacillus sp. es.036 TaxID=1761764 RepID=UPI000BFA73F5|nr:N-formylglutamate amidohydrolase [Bacillus sp. es.036]PFG15072.1 N-formylglutamate amidohydrolase [Bacillus sp. es.036]